MVNTVSYLLGSLWSVGFKKIYLFNIIFLRNKVINVIKYEKRKSQYINRAHQT